MTRPEWATWISSPSAPWPGRIGAPERRCARSPSGPPPFPCRAPPPEARPARSAGAGCGGPREAAGFRPPGAGWSGSEQSSCGLPLVIRFAPQEGIRRGQAAQVPHPQGGRRDGPRSAAHGAARSRRGTPRRGQAAVSTRHVRHGADRGVRNQAARRATPQGRWRSSSFLSPDARVPWAPP